jgi:hypothetical protein
MDWKSKWATQLASLGIWFGLGPGAQKQWIAEENKEAQRQRNLFIEEVAWVGCVKEVVSFSTPSTPKGYVLWEKFLFNRVLLE